MKYKHTMYASYVGYITQAIVNNLAPLLFVIFQKELSISLSQIATLVFMNFAIQMFVDAVAAKFITKTGYRVPIVLAHIFAAVGLVGLGIFPHLFANPFWGLVTAITCYAIGGGLIEVLISPIVEALPNEAKASAMSLLHSFYCWGHVGVVILSTVYFAVAGTNNWVYLPILWAIIPLCNSLWFTKVPIRTLEDNTSPVSLKTLFSQKVFWILMILMICSGAAEQAMSQWASLFAETGLGISKQMGDLVGPCAFAILMGSARVFYGKFGERIDLTKFVSASSVLCIISYLIAAFSPIPAIALIGCALCGLSVGIMWPGVFSLSTGKCPGGGTAMFAILAMAGDIGCSAGPGLVGWVSAATHTNGLQTGFMLAAVFPIALFIGIRRVNRVKL